MGLRLDALRVLDRRGTAGLAAATVGAIFLSLMVCFGDGSWPWDGFLGAGRLAMIRRSRIIGAR